MYDQIDNHRTSSSIYWLIIGLAAPAQLFWLINLPCKFLSLIKSEINAFMTNLLQQSLCNLLQLTPKQCWTERLQALVAALGLKVKHLGIPRFNKTAANLNGPWTLLSQSLCVHEHELACLPIGSGLVTVVLKNPSHSRRPYNPDQLLCRLPVWGKHQGMRVLNCLSIESHGCFPSAQVHTPLNIPFGPLPLRLSLWLYNLQIR